MATVWLVHDTRHDRKVALKVLSPELAQAVGAERFQREVRLTAQLRHPHILPVHDSGETDGLLWYTMPFAEGESLRDRLNREGALPVEESLRIVRETALALDYAHRHGVIHRDIKPDNILLEDGQAVVADFGIARPAPDGGATGPQLTGTGLAVGTPAYMSPEQAMGQPVDGRTDVYALGCVCYELLSGAPPFVGSSPQAVLAMALTGDAPALETRRPDLPPDLSPVIARAMAREPGDRYPTAGAFAEALGAVGTAASLGTLLGARRSRIRSPAWIAAGMVVVAAAAGATALFFGGSGDEGVPGRLPRLAVLPFVNLGTEDDAFFAEGVTDEIRARLAQLSSLEVVSGASTREYAGSTKPPADIGRELGVDYLLAGRVLWDHQAGEIARVRIQPELLAVPSGVTRWQESFVETLADIFDVQGRIALQVAAALDVALGSRDTARVVARPTASLAAWEAYLRGNEAGGHFTQLTIADRREAAIAYYRRAVTLDPEFGVAWAALARSQAFELQFGTNPELLATTQEAAGRAIALDSGLATAWHALGDIVLRSASDWRGALAFYRQGLDRAPRDVDLLAAVGGALQDAGEWDESRRMLEQAVALDPRNPLTRVRLGATLLFLRSCTQALAQFQTLAALEPAGTRSLAGMVAAHACAGDLEAGWRVLRDLPPGMDRVDLISDLVLGDDLFWVFAPEDEALLLRLPAAEEDRPYLLVSRALIHEMRGRGAAARASADSADQQFRKVSRGDGVGDAQTFAYHGIALALMDRPVEGLAAARRAVDLVPPEVNAYFAPIILYHLAQVHRITGSPDSAVAVLGRVLAMPAPVTRAGLRSNPEWTPLRGDPGFRALVGIP